MRLMTRYLALLATAFALTSHAYADESAGWLESSWNTVADTYTHGKSELYLPLHTHHVRSAYSAEKIASFQENPYGIGYGRGTYDEKGNWHGVYAMGFQDSHFKPQWMAGYSWKAIWGQPLEGWHVGLGYTAFLMARGDIVNYTPFPGVLPIASVGYKKFSLESTYVPGTKGAGNIFFFWGKWEFGE